LGQGALLPRCPIASGGHRMAGRAQDNLRERDAMTELGLHPLMVKPFATAAACRAGLVGALSIEAAARHLVRDLDGIARRGFPRVMDAFLTVLTEDARSATCPCRRRTNCRAMIWRTRGRRRDRHGRGDRLPWCVSTPSAHLSRTLHAIDAEGATISGCSPMQPSNEISPPLSIKAWSAAAD
jgi:hypothetical protein